MADITFQCACGEILSAPPSLAGTKTRCWSCKQLVAIPASPGPAAPGAPGGSGWVPDAPGREARGSSCRNHPGTPRTTSCAACGASLCSACVVWTHGDPRCAGCAKSAPKRPGGPGMDRGTWASGGFGLEAASVTPWERRGELGTLKALWETFKGVATDPVNFFQRIEPEGQGHASFYVVAQMIGALGTLSVQLLVIALGGLAPAGPGGHPGIPPGLGPAVAGIVLVACLVFGPILLWIGFHVGSAIYHVLLVLTGAAERGFTATSRAFAYGTAPNMLGIIPFVGPMVGGVWSLVTVVIGLKEIHRTTYLRVILAVFLIPCLLCGGLFALVFLVLVSSVRSGMPSPVPGP